MNIFLNLKCTFRCIYRRNETSESIFKTLFVIITFLFLVACENESLVKYEVQRDKSINNPHSKYLVANKSNQIISRTDRYTISEALEYLNDGMNYLYCRPSDVYDEGITFTDTFSIAVSSQEIEEDDLIELMDTIAYFAGDHYYADIRSSKEPILFHVVPLSTSSSYINIEVTFLMEAGSVSSAEDEYPYETDWVYAQWFGENNEECNEEQGFDSAAKLFHRDLNKNIVYRNQIQAFYLLYPEVTCFDPAGAECTSLHNLPTFPNTNIYGGSLRNPDPNDDLDNLFDFLLFLNKSNLSNFSPCLIVNEMNFYYESMEDLAMEMVPYPPGNRVIAALFSGWDRSVGFQTVLIWHPMKVITASKISTDEDNSIPLPCHCAH